jgi:hypothetical protein
MTNFTHDVAAFVLPVTASSAAVAAAFVAFTTRRQAVPAVAVQRPQTDLMGTSVWFGGTALGSDAKRITGTTSYDPQSRGSSG